MCLVYRCTHGGWVNGVNGVNARVNGVNTGVNAGNFDRNVWVNA